MGPVLAGFDLGEPVPLPIFGFVVVFFYIVHFGV